ncbi:type I restriction enzyme HsdR N-terminal domain-containing protein [endosymbiont GvMRE of Glomus versiforme]|uniref:type I restriction enzyme HsdR N-terminal domain-containing protein n=1 Tax=endosymbiont GvMRE of Glomus versiforme TaxID=2039283 RepID=UPI000ED3D326|nr:type I restriction enzyme HsdR N-terminal domain-containing protein [endosymbiont GvMRE of Glomus versiforme]RHZ36369.1 Type I restriction enzyme M protein [endosymbiont GvMRE of Glomus versiforme]
MSKLDEIAEKLKNFFINYWWVILIVLIALILLIVLISWLSKEAETREKKLLGNVLVCPIRGRLKRGKYAADGRYSEEYWTIKLVKWFLNRGYEKEQIGFEHVIRIGRDGHNSLRVDLTVKKNGKFFAVVEVKNNSREIESAIKHQLIPAMRILNARHGIYFDGTKKSRMYTRNEDGSLSCKSFP